MPKVEIEESELAGYQQVNKFVQTALTSPKTRRAMLELQKTLNPDAAIPEIDATNHVLEAMKPLQEQIASLGKSIEDMRNAESERTTTQRLNGRVEQGRSALQTAGYNAEGVEKIEKLMLDRGIADYDAGLALFERINPPSQPVNDPSSRWGSNLPSEIEEGADYAELWKTQGQDDQWLKKALRGSRWQIN